MTFSIRNFLFYSLFLTLFSSCVKLDQTMKVFFPQELSDLHRIQTDFPVFWWNFVVVEADSVSIDEVCKSLKSHVNHELSLVICGPGNQIPFELLNSWSKDIFSRSSFSSDHIIDYKEEMNSAMVLATFSSGKDFLNFLRLDPLQSWKDYESKITNQSLNSIELKNGYFYLKGSNEIVIPVQFNDKPSLGLVKPIMDLMETFSGHTFLLGVHGSAYRNEFQVRKDLEIVSIMTIVAFILFLIFLVVKAGWIVLILSFPVSIAILISAQVIQLTYGSIHGLTLSFGSGVIGLALDYGIHGLLGRESNRTWHSNFIGMITTLCGILVLVASGIPLIRQMMLFSTMGLIIAFSIYYFLFKYFKNFYDIKKFKLILPYFRFSQVLILAIVIFGLVELRHVHMNMDLKKMNLVSDKEVQYSKALFSQDGKISETYMLIHKNVQSDFFSQRYLQKAQKYEIPYQGVDLFIPSPEVQLKNQISWKQQGCFQLWSQMSSEQKLFFKPFYDEECDPLKILKPIDITQRKYVSQFVSNQEELSLFYPQTSVQILALEKEIPEAKSIVKSIMKFSEVLQKELLWMIPLALLLTLIILYWYYRRVKYVLCSIFPFLAGMSLFLISAAIFKIEIDLIAILGLVMVFGFSIDYGVFSTDAHIFKFDHEEKENVYTALTLAAVTNLLGFLPMIFAVHPVLKQFGFPLFFGTLGTYLGTVYGLKYFLETKEAV